MRPEDEDYSEEVGWNAQRRGSPYLAFRAVIRCAREWNRTAERKIESILCPGLGTAVGRMPPRRCAVQMHYAYGTSHLGQIWKPINLGQAKDVHQRMLP